MTPVDLTTFQNRDTLNRRMTTTAPPQRSAASTCQRRVGVEELQAAQHPVVRPLGMQPQVDVDRAQPPLVADHAALGRARGARGVVDVRDVAALARRRRPEQQLVPPGRQAVGLVVAGHDHVAQLRAVAAHRVDQLLVLRADDHQHGRGVAQHVPRVVLLHVRVDRDQRGPQRDHGQPGDHELGPVVQDDRHHVAGPDPLASAAAKLSTASGQVAPGHGQPVLEDQQRPVRVPLAGVSTSSMTVFSGAWLQGAPACSCRTTAFNNRPFAQGALRQATSCSPAESGTACRRGSVAWQPSSAIGHRGWNRQPGGIADASATSPPSSVT